MKNKSLQENFSELNDVIKRYLNARVNLWKVQLLEKIVKTWTHLFVFILTIVSVLFIFLLLALAFSFWYGNKYGDMSTGFLISAGIFAFLSFLIFLLRRPLFSNSIIRNISSVIFDDDKNQKE
jgi:hypothetical protein